MLLDAERTQIILRKAADAIRQRGNTRGAYGYGATGPVCLAGAIRVAINGIHNWTSGVPAEHDRQYHRALKAVNDRLRETGRMNGCADAIHWQDDECVDENDAIRVLRDTADTLL